MLNYIRAELYRNFNRLYFWNFAGITSILALVFNILMKSVDSGNLSMLLQMGIGMLNVPIFLVGIVIDMVIGEELKNLTLKNVVSFGISRKKIVLSKIIVTVILSFIAAVIILTFYLGSGAILFGVEGVSLALFKDFLLRLLAAIPLWIGAISVGTLMGFIFKNNTIFAFAYAFMFVSISSMLKVLSFFISDKIMYIHNVLITTKIKTLSALTMTPANNIQAITTDSLISAVVIGVIYTVVFSILSILHFSKKEVK